VNGLSDCIDCAAGRYGTSTGQSNPQCTGICSRGYYCPSGSTSATAADCPAGKYGATTGLGTATCSGNVGPGYWSTTRADRVNPTSLAAHRGEQCPAGRFGAGGASSSSCSGPCQAGYYCPIGSGSASQTQCGGPDKFCPTGSSTASSVSSGFYSTPTLASTANIRSGQAQCEPGNSCNGGIRTACAAGRFQATAGATVCSGTCNAGFFCPAGSSVGSAQPCGGADKYCPAGRPTPLTVAAGHYSTPESAPSTQRTGQAQCTEEEFCAGGIRTKRIVFPTRCTAPVAGNNAYADTWGVDENVAAATVANLPFSKLGTNTLTTSLVHIGSPAPAAGCPQSQADMSAMFDLSTTGSNAALTLKAGRSFNFETCPFYALTIRFVLSSPTTPPTFQCTVNIAVGDVNDSPTFKLDTRHLGGRFLREVYESARESSAVPVTKDDPVSDSRINAEDEDSGQELRYEILGGLSDLSIGVCSGQLFVAAPLSFETTAVYDFSVRITDNGVPPLSADYPVRVTVVDVNEPPVFQNLPYSFRVEENQPANFLLSGALNSEVSALDQDTGAVLTYSMVVLDSDPSNPPFVLASTGGRLRATRLLDFEEAADPDGDGERQFRVIFTVQDSPIPGGTSTFNTTQAAVVTLIDTNDPPRLLNIGSAGNPQFTNLFFLDENTASGTVVGPVRAEDSDGDNIATMLLSGTHAANFDVTGSGTAWTLTTLGSPFDFEALPAAAKFVDLTLTMTDDDSVDPRSTSVSLRVNIRNVNERSTVATGQSVSFRENAVQTTLSTVALSASDPDNIYDLTWQVDGGNAALFAVSQDGRLSPNTVSLDFETTQSYTVQVRTVDSGNPAPSLASPYQDVTVMITNVNEAPIITSTNFNLPENSAPSTVVGTVAVTDPDAGDTHTFAALGGADLMNPRDPSEALFVINPATGEITVAPGILTDPWRSGLDFERKSVLSLTVTVSDAGNDGSVLSHTKTITVTLTDVDESPQIVDPQNRTIVEQSPAGTNVGPPVSVLDQENTTITCTVSSFIGSYATYAIDTACQISVTTGVADIPDFAVYVEIMPVTASDANGNSHTANVNIVVVASNTAPTLNPLSLTWPEVVVSTYNVTQQADDADAAQTLSYFITQTSPSLASGWFVVDQSTGILSSTAAVDFESLPASKVVTLTMVVQDDGPGQLTATAPWTITVSNVNEAPVLGSMSAFTVPETGDVPGADLSATLGPLTATDVDGDTLTFSLAHLSGPPMYFAVDGTPVATPASRNLMLGGITVSHEVRGALEPHRLNLTVTDSGTPPLSAFKIITVQVTDVNEGPVLQKTSLDAFEIPEDSVLPGFSLPTNRRVSFQNTTGRASGGFVTAVDPDTNDPTVFGKLVFSLQSHTDVFRIDDAGVLRVQDGVQLDFETTDRYDVQVRACDSAPAPMCTATETYEVLIRDVADIVVTSFHLVDVAQNMQVTSVPTTGGNVHIIFNGTDFARQSDVNSGATVTAQATFHTGVDPTLPSVTVTDCRLLTRTSVICKHPAGYGEATWQLTIRNTPAAFLLASAGVDGLVRTRYTAPTLTSATLVGGADPVSTEGGATVEFVGTNLGAVGSTLNPSTVQYGPDNRFTMQSCVRTVAHTTMRCVMAAGWSVNLPFSVRIGGLAGTGLTSSISYAAPSITNVTMSASLSPTVGGPRITITGRNFAAAGHGLLVGVGMPFPPSQVSAACTKLDASAAISSAHRYVALSCVRSNNNPHRVIMCTMPPGSGTNLPLYVETFLTGAARQYIQTSAWSFNTLSYMAPSLSQVLGNGVFEADTEGGQLISLRGSNFGPSAPCQNVVVGDSALQCTNVGAERAGVPAVQQPIVQYARTSEVATLGLSASRWFAATGCIVRDVGQIECCSSPGTGGNFTYRVQVDGQWNPVPLVEEAASYHVPIVETYTVPNVVASASVKSATQGGDKVVIVGLHFGASTATLDSVRYGVNDNKEFESSVATCTMVVPHKQLECITAPGAGADMSWIVTVDGQRSEVPSTGYGRPEVTGFGTPTTGMSTAGGERVVILGSNFGPPVNASTRARMLANGHVFLDWVKYGPVSGQEYTAAGCVVLSHTSIECTTVPGSGSDLRWTVSVAGLVSDAPSFLWSYARPSINAIVIDGTPTTAGGIIGTISGQNFAVQDPQTQLVVRVTLPFYNFARTSRFPAYMAEQGWLDPADPTKWASITVPDTAPTFKDIAVQGATAGGNDIVDFAIPEGVGRNVSVQLLQVPRELGMSYATTSAPVYYDYAPPGAPLGAVRTGFVYQTQDIDSVETIITIKGSSLGKGHGSNFYDGFLQLDREIVLPEHIISWGHTEIKFQAFRDGVLTPDQASDNTSALAGSGTGSVFTDNHFHISLLVFDNVVVVPEFSSVTVPGTPPSFTVDTFNATCNCTQQVLQDNSTLVQVPTGNFSEPQAQWWTTIDEVQGTSPGFLGRSGDDSPSPTRGNVSIQFLASNIGSEMNLLDVFVGENVVMEGAMDGRVRATAVPRDNICEVTNIDYDDLARRGEVTCTLPAGQGATNRLRFVWNNKDPDANSTGALDRALVAYQTPTLTNVSAVAEITAVDPVRVDFEAYTVGVGAAATPEEVMHFQFPTEGGDMTFTGSNLGLTGGVAFVEYRHVTGSVNAPAHQFDGLVQPTSFGSISYARTLGHTHEMHRVSIPPSMNLQANVQYLLRYRYCGAVGCPEFVLARSDCGSLAPGTGLVEGQVCDTADQRIDGNPQFKDASDRNVRNTILTAGNTMLQAYPFRADLPDRTYISFSYQPAVVDIAATTADSRTVGGGVLTINGRNFGPADAQPAANVSVQVDGVACPIMRDVNGNRVTDAGVSAHRQIKCTMPPGSGRAVPYTVTIGSVTVAVPAALSQVNYNSPVVFGMDRHTAPTSGKSSEGSDIRITVFGDNFGSDPSRLVMRLLSNPEAVSESREVNHDFTAASVTLVNDTVLSFIVPAGSGAVKLLEITVSAQSTSDSMSVPLTGGAWPSDNADLSVHSAQPYAPLVFRYNDPVLTAAAGDVGTRGGVLVLFGRNFGRFLDDSGSCLASSATVTLSTILGTQPISLVCDLAPFCGSQTHERLQCFVPPGVGANYTILLTQSSRSAELPREFSYLPPILEDVSPTPARADVNFEITLTGQNFGNADRSNVTVFIGGVQCLNARIEQTDTTTLDVIKCDSQAQTVGPKSLRISVAFQDVFFAATDGWVELNCPETQYGQVGEVCQDCPNGGFCYVHADPTDSCMERIPNVGCNLYREPIAAAQAWKFNLTLGETLCKRGVRPDGFEESCPVMVGCDPPEACAGNNLCSRGYTGVRCGLCELGFFRLDGECVKCPDLGWLFILLFVVGIFTVCGLGMLLNRYKVNLAFISIGVDYFQVLGLFARSKVQWPAIIKNVLSALSVFNLNLDLAAPECASPDLRYTDKWVAIMMLPLIIFSFFGLAHLGKYVYKRWFKAVAVEKRNSHLPTLVSTSLLMFYLLYLYLTRTTFDIFNCSPTDPDDGYTYLEVVFERCWESDTHKLLFPLALCTLVLYVLAYPALVFYILNKNKDSVKIDQLLRAKGLGDTRFESTNAAYDTRKSFSKLYYQFKPGKWYWQPVIVARKFMIAVTSLFFRGTPSFQMALIVALLFFSFAAQVKQRPYMSSSEKRAEELYHEQKVLEGVPRHMKLDQSLKAVTRRIASRGKKQNMDAIKKTAERAPAAQFVTNFNTIETTLLTCAILVAMAAVLFESRRLKNGSSPVVREALVWITLFIIFGSIVYFLVVAFIEIFDTVAPDMFASCCKCCKAKKSTIELEAERGMAGMKAAQPDDAATAINPMLAGSLAGSKSMSPDEIEAIMAMLRSGETPNHPQWQAIRTHMLRQRTEVADMTNEIRVLKKAATVRSAKASLSSESEDRKNRRPRGAGKSRRNFKQSATRRSTTSGPGGKAGPGISKTSANRMRGDGGRGDNVLG